MQLSCVNSVRAVCTFVTFESHEKKIQGPGVFWYFEKNLLGRRKAD